jgi:LuxR family maltose regulon positive regulatory protein
MAATRRAGNKAAEGSGASEPVLVQTKLTRPPERSEQIGRAELVPRLREAATRPLTVVTGPPGFGKTTLLAAWAADEQRAAWLSLDEDDNDPARFFAYTVAALQAVEPQLGTQALAAQRTPRASLVDMVLPLFVNELVALDDEIVLVLDDYHLISEPEIHAALTYLLERQPSPLRLVLATREDPPLPLGRLRARGQLAELRTDELRFSTEETSLFLNDVLALGLSADELQRLHARTEGWPAALYLAALSLKGSPEPGALIDAFTGDNRHLVDFLTAEVLAQQPPELRTFLLRTSILDRFCGHLCDVVADRSDSDRVLVELERSNLLLVPLDAKREWYRYHQLFAQLLRFELTRNDADLVPALHRRASAWYGEHGFIVEAADHANAAGDVDAAVELVGRYYSLFLGRGQLATVERWLDALPESVVANDWLLCFAAAMVTSHTGRIDEAEHWVELAAKAPPLARNGQEPASPVAALQAWIRLLRGDIGGAISNARRALAAAAPGDLGTMLGVQMLLGGALWWAGEVKEAADVLQETTRIAQNAGLAAPASYALGVRAAIALDQDDTTDAEALVQEGATLLRRPELDEHPFTATLRIVDGKLRGKGGEVERGIQLAERVGAWQVAAYGLLTLAEIRQREHQPAAARRLLARVRDQLASLPDPGAGMARLERTEQTLRLRAAREHSTVDTPFWELSERELAVLRLLPSRLSQREIAAELYVSFNTVKTHMRSIFRKLGVASRDDAVTRARELGLL